MRGGGEVLRAFAMTDWYAWRTAGGIAETEPDDTRLGLVRKIRRFDLEHDRVTDGLRGGDGLALLLHETLFDNWYAVRRKHCLRLALRERGAGRVCEPSGCTLRG